MSRRRVPWPRRSIARITCIIVLAGVGNASAEDCDVRPDLPSDTARRILAACTAEFRIEARRRDTESDLFRWLGRAQYPAKLADFLSTEIALPRPGVYEANPLMGNRYVRVATLAAVPVVSNWASAELYHAGHERWAVVFRIAALALPAVLTVHNLRQ